MSSANKDLEEALPELRSLARSLNDGEYADYEKRLSKATKKAMDALEAIIDDGTLQMDPEQTVKAVEVLTKSKMALVEAKRKLMETCVKGEVMLKALNDGKDKDDGQSALLEYLKKSGLDASLDSTGGQSAFERIAAVE